MSDISRRTFLGAAAVGVAGMAISGCAMNMNTKTGVIMPKKKTRVVVVGGGFGGTTAAKYVRLLDPSVEVILIEPEANFVSCPMSNLVIGGLKNMDFITHPYRNLHRGYGIIVIPARAMSLDADNRNIHTTAGVIEYDRLIVSPGIDFKYETIDGMDERAQVMYPHAWKAGRQTEALRRKLKDMKPGGTVVIGTPPAPYRCPPGPYERACLIANFLKKEKPGSKLVMLDASDGIASKGKLFSKAFTDYYADIIDYRPANRVVKVDAETGVITGEKGGEVKADVANIIPAQKAGSFAFATGIVPEGEEWAPVDPFTFASTVYENVHVIGDATNLGTVGLVPKSGFIANSEGKVAASAVTALLKGEEPPAPSMANACYSMVNETEAIWVTAVYHYDSGVKRIMPVSDAKGLSPERSEVYGKQAMDWAANIWSDMLL